MLFKVIFPGFCNVLEAGQRGVMRGQTTACIGGTTEYLPHQESSHNIRNIFATNTDQIQSPKEIDLMWERLGAPH